MRFITASPLLQWAEREAPVLFNDSSIRSPWITYNWSRVPAESLVTAEATGEYEENYSTE